MAKVEQIDVALSELETRIERLRALYEQYFMGIERIEPSVPRKDVERRVQELRKTRFQNTAKRFKFQTLVQRYNTMQQYWSRTCREIENGTYRRHKLKAERTIGRLEARKQEEAEARREAIEQEEERAQRAASVRESAEKDLRALLDGKVDLESEMGGALAALDASASQGRSPSGLLGKLAMPSQGSGLRGSAPLTSVKPTVDPLASLDKAPAPGGAQPAREQPAANAGPAASAPSAEKPPAKPSDDASPAPNRVAAAAAARERTANARAGALSDDRIKALHKAYVDARSRTNASSVSYEKLSRSIRETEQKLRRSHKGRNVDFDVVVKDGRAILKPRLS